jgi:hypothetical protein
LRAHADHSVRPYGGEVDRLFDCELVE